MFPYIGGKSSHAKWISPYIPSDISTYVEVFGGAMWLYFQSDKTPVETNVYNDWNRHLANIFKCSIDTDHHREVLESYICDIGSEEMFNEYRDEIFGIYDGEFHMPDYPLAAKYMLCQLQTFSGNTNFREDTKIYRSPDPKHKFVAYTEKFSQPKYVKKLNRLTVENMDCRDLIHKYDDGDTFFYIDPPYYNMESYYTADDFDHDDHIELLELLKTTEARWALSYYHFDDLERILPRDQYLWHEQETYSQNARVSTAKRTELLIMNYQPPSLESLFGP